MRSEGSDDRSCYYSTTLAILLGLSSKLFGLYALTQEKYMQEAVIDRINPYLGALRMEQG